MARTRPFVKVHLSVADHRKTSAIWADPRARGMLVELWRKACEKYAGHLGDKVMLKPTDRMEIAGTTDQQQADEAVSSLCRSMKYRLTRHPNRWEAHIRKFSKKQGFEPKELDQNSATSPASETPIPKLRNSETPKAERGVEEAPPAPPAPRSPRVSGKRPCPEFLDEEAVDRIREWGSANGIEYHRLPAAWECFRDWAHSNDKRQANWEAGFRNALRRGWVLERRSANESGEAESAAQAKVRRSKEAAARVIQMLDRKTNGGLIA